MLPVAYWRKTLLFNILHLWNIYIYIPYMMQIFVLWNIHLFISVYTYMCICIYHAFWKEWALVVYNFPNIRKILVISSEIWKHWQTILWWVWICWWFKGTLPQHKWLTEINQYMRKVSSCRRCSNYIFILDLTSGFKGFGKDSRKTVWESFKCWDLVRLMLKTWRYIIIWPVERGGDLCEILQQEIIICYLKVI